MIQSRHHELARMQHAKVAKRPAFIPDSSEEVDLENDISSLPVLEGFEPIEGDE